MKSPKRVSVHEKYTVHSVWVSKHPPPTKPLPPLPADQNALPLGTVLSARLSSNTRCRSDMQRNTCDGSVFKDEPQAADSPTGKRSFTPDHVAGLCSQLDACNLSKRGSISSSCSFSKRTRIPVPSLASSCSSSSTVVESDSPPTPTGNELNGTHYNALAATAKPTSVYRRPKRPLAIKSQRIEARRTISPPMPSPVPDGNRFQTRLPPFQNGHDYHPGRAVPVVPSRSSNDSKLSNVSFIDWDSDDEDYFLQFAKVNASLKKGIADIRATRKTKPRCPTHKQASQTERKLESSYDSSRQTDSRRSNKVITYDATILRKKRSQNLRRSTIKPGKSHRSARSASDDKNTRSTAASSSSADSPETKSTQILVEKTEIIAPAQLQSQPQPKPINKHELRKKPKTLSDWIKKASCA